MSLIYEITDVNHDGVTDFKDFFIILKEIMKKQETVKTLEGEAKKRNTLNTIKLMIGIPTYQRYEPMIECALEFIHQSFFIKKCFKCK